MLEFHPTCPICDLTLRAVSQMAGALAEIAEHLEDSHGITLIRVVSKPDTRRYADPPASPNWRTYATPAARP